MSTKPLNGKAYGHIPHLPGSRLGLGDHKLTDGQARILTQKCRDRYDTIIVQEKLDGSCVAVYRDEDCRLIPLIRAGYLAVDSPYQQHHLFAKWVESNAGDFYFLDPGERVCGEWIAQAHGTRYACQSPFVAFDLFLDDGTRELYEKFMSIVGGCLVTAKLLHYGGPCSIENALERLGRHGHHGAIDPAEGCVWRCERNGEVEFLGKYVRPDKVDGCYLPEMTNCEPIWNWEGR